MTSEQRQFARRLRRQLTGAEDLLWDMLRNRRLDGMKFRRQEPLLSYTADFLCVERKLIVELDGKQHGWDRDYDAARTAAIERHGFTVLRFPNDAVLNDIDSVIARIKEAATQNPLL